MASFTIRKAESPDDLSAAVALFQAYATWLNIDLSFQAFAAETAGMPGKYASPTGTLLLARENASGSPIGCVGVRPLPGGAVGCCEMKRLFVRPAGRGSGAGKALADAAVREAKALGYRAMRLDTLQRMAAARQLYTSMGFKEIAAYYNTPLKDTVFLELQLA